MSNQLQNQSTRRVVQQRRSSSTTTSLLSTIATLSTLLTTTTTVHALDSDCQPPTASPYTGFSLKINTDCSQYVNCQNGIITSHHTCPTGLLYNGKVGVGGICDWESNVQCVDEVGLAFDALNIQGVSEVDETFDTTTASSEADDTTKVTVTIQTTDHLADAIAANTQQSSSSATTDNPDNFYCGKTSTHAATICKPCPSGLMVECADDFTYGCFKHIDGCGASSSAGSSSSGSNIVAQSSGSGAAQSTTPEIQPVFPQMVLAPSPSQSAPSPTVVVADSVSVPVIPTNKPSLPPWTNAPFNPSPSGSTSKTVIGYYASWQWYDRNKFADPTNIPYHKYDRINYAFFQPDTLGNLYGTDEWADSQLLFGPYVYNEADQSPSNYKCSWDGPNLTNCAHHDTSKGLVYLAKQAGVEVMPSIGGWTLSDNFPTIAASASKREHFANQCVKLIDNYGFDGIDLDWEYPGYEDHSGTPGDTINFTLLLKTIRQKLDALGAATNKFYGLTAALPCGPDKIDKIEVSKIKNYLTELNLMSYDMHGAWDALTGTNAPMFDQGWGDKSKRWSTHGCVNTYAELGVPLSQMNIGLPFYGRSYRTATGMKQFHDGVDDLNYHLDEGSPQYFNIVNQLSRMKTYRHEKTQTQFAVFNDGSRGVVSYDDARSICDKVHYANQRGMHGFLVWEISGDMIDMGNGNMITPLIDATNTKIANPNFDCSTLRDPTWALSEDQYRYAPDEPDTVDWSLYDAPEDVGGSTNDFNGAVPVDSYASFTAPGPTTYVDADSAPSLNAVYVSPSTPSIPAPSPSSNSSGDCPLSFTGYYATAGCTSYVYCTDGNVVGASLPCVPGTLFDVTIGVCTWAANVQCGTVS